MYNLLICIVHLRSLWYYSATLHLQQCVPCLSDVTVFRFVNIFQGVALGWHGDTDLLNIRITILLFSLHLPDDN